MDRYTTVAQIDRVMPAYKADIMFTRMDHPCDVEDEKHIKIYIDKLRARRKELEKPFVDYLPRPETAQTLVSTTETDTMDVEPLYDGDEPTETMHLHRTLNPHVEGRAVRQCDRCSKHFYRNGFNKDGWNGIIGLALGDPIVRVCRRCSDATDHDDEHSDDTDGIQSVTFEGTPPTNPSPQYISTPIDSDSDDSGADNGGDDGDEYQVSGDDSGNSGKEVRETQTYPNHHTNPSPPNTTSIGVGVWATKPKPKPIRRGEEFYKLFTDVLGLPEESWVPATTAQKPVARTTFTLNKTKNYADKSRFNHSKLQSSEIQGNRLLQAYAQYRDRDGNIRKGKVLLDTYSNVNYVAGDVGLPREIRQPWEQVKVTGIGQQQIRLRKPLAFSFVKEEQPFVIDSWRAPTGLLPEGCVALLGLDAITMLGIDLNHAASNQRHVEVQFLPEKTSHHDQVRERAKENAIDKYPLKKQLERFIQKRCYLSERICKAYLEKNPEEYAQKKLDEGAIDISPVIPRHLNDRITSFFKTYEPVFTTKTNTLPKPLKHVQPHAFKLKPGATPTQTGRPRFGPAQSKIISDWVAWAVKEDLIERADGAAWSSRLILAPKFGPNTPKSALPDGIRIAWAGVEVNERIEKTVPTYPNAWEQLYKVANFKYKFSADGLKQYWSIPLAEASREVTAFWTPDGLYKFKRLVMGTKNAATIAQNAYTNALNTMLDPSTHDHIANFADDFLGGADTLEGLVDHFENFLKMCLATGITLNPKKIRIGYEKEQFYGLSIDKGKIEPAERNLDPIHKMTNPRNASEMRSVMGVFNQFSSFIPNYGKAGSPAALLQPLTSNTVDYEFTKKHEQAIDQLKKTVLSGVHLWAPHPDYPLVLETDGSDDGWGAVLFQNIENERRIIKMWSKQWKTEAWQKKPPYHREAKAWMNGLTLTIPYALQSKFPVDCWTDHTPLTWIKHTSGKGPVSQFILDTLSVVDYNMHYIKGPENKTADGLSRFPMLGPGKLRQKGVVEALDILLATLVDTDVDPARTWFNTGKDTPYMVNNFYDWRDQIIKNRTSTGTKPVRTHCYMDPLSASKIQKLKYTFGIWAPPADKVVRQCRAALDNGTPFACLIPNDLVHYIAKDQRKHVVVDLQRKVDRATKITLLSPGLTWLISGISFAPTNRFKTVYAGPRVTPDYELEELVRILKDSNMTPPVAQFSTRDKWIEAQVNHQTHLLYDTLEGIHHTPDGLLVYEERPGAPLRTIVPDVLQIPLVEWQHKNLCHVGSQKILTVLKQTSVGAFSGAKPTLC